MNSNAKRQFEYHSKAISKGDTFICLPKGEDFISKAKENGAETILKLSRQEFAEFSAKHYHHPSRSLSVIGVTGTNGKTSTCSFVTQALTRLGCKAAQIGTLTQTLTTPESLDIQESMANHLSQGGTHFVMEVSSHGIDQHRVSCIEFDVKALTNITQDHLDYHGSFDAYESCKLSWMEAGDMPSLFFNELSKTAAHLELKEKLSVTCPHLKGRFNQDNLCLSGHILLSLGFSQEEVLGALSSVSSPPGRFEFIDEGQSFTVIVDYAHTPDGLDNVLTAARELCSSEVARVICVFGCGGDRDTSKRPQMARIVAEKSDLCIVTADNPRTEPQAQITKDILTGFPISYQAIEVIESRKDAIAFAIRSAKPDDVVVIAGKGHEDYQIFETETIFFDDRVVSREILNASVR